jgi:hypothetical protein
LNIAQDTKKCNDMQLALNHKPIWTLDCHKLTLNLTRWPFHAVDLTQCRTLSQTLKTIVVVSEQKWANDEIVGSLVRMLTELLGIDKCVHNDRRKDRLLDVRKLGKISGL